MNRLKSILKKMRWPAAILAVGYFLCALPELFHQNEGESRSLGSVRDGALENGWLAPRSGPNFSFFSGLSYFVADNGYAHARVVRAIVAAYAACEKTCPATHFRLMETSDKTGGRLAIHRTHQNGLSADFMSPKLFRGRPTRLTDGLGYAHYLLDFDENGRLFGLLSIEIDFETMARHLLALDEAAQAEGLRIRKVIWRLRLKDELFAAPSGKKLLERGIYFVERMPYWTDRVHDDHYHVDFELAK